MKEGNHLQFHLEVWRQRLSAIHARENRLRREAAAASEAINNIKRLALEEGIELK